LARLGQGQGAVWAHAGRGFERRHGADAERKQVALALFAGVLFGLGGLAFGFGASGQLQCFFQPGQL
jgi:hypothetical protein